MIVSILGCGWYGKAFAKTLLAQGVSVNGSVTSAEKLNSLGELGITPYVVSFKSASKDYDPEFFKCDILIISIPPKTRQGEASDYLPKINGIIEAILKYQIKRVIYISSTAVYGDINSEVDEFTVPLPDTEAGKILLAAERHLQHQTSFKTTILRFSGLVGPGRHPGRFFAGKADIPNGKAPVNLIHLDDCIGITLEIINKNAFGLVVNASSPDHPTKAEFYSESARKAGLIIPQFRDELTGWKIIGSRAINDVLGYKFKVSSWKDCSFDD
ncbi:SDR family oxidoreductase [Mucilaginibacter sp. BJC16-A38]|uniref:SDR family oxidoreductase n=1 Tax=Mucilaginibacter phenanthrenivorans TaxID=1234842 RepID=UPI00215769FC|nr:SDR family oxidoreductase [Mucilaginibacter phenanthrenivorans]MCR8556420.1 SDR family oxidoreductase [Mucilaginibacter phenanthrenivorans]